MRAPAILGRIEGLERLRTGQVVVGETLQTTRDPAIFATRRLRRLPAARNRASGPGHRPGGHQQARHLVRHLSRHPDAWHSSGAMAPFRYRDQGTLVSLADDNGWRTLGRSTFGGGRLGGLLARLAHDLLYRRHQIGLVGPFRGPLAWIADDLAHVVGRPVRLDRAPDSIRLRAGPFKNRS